MPKLGVDASPRPHAHRRAWFIPTWKCLLISAHSLENHCYYINVCIDFDTDPAEHIWRHFYLGFAIPNENSFLEEWGIRGITFLFLEDLGKWGIKYLIPWGMGNIIFLIGNPGIPKSSEPWVVKTRLIFTNVQVTGCFQIYTVGKLVSVH